jgi:hypothetical protein
MNDIEAEEHRNLQARFHRCTLELIRKFHPADVERRAKQSLASEIEMFGAGKSTIVSVELLKLAELFRERHLRDQLIDTPFDRRSRALGRRRECKGK